MKTWPDWSAGFQKIDHQLIRLLDFTKAFRLLFADPRACTGEDVRVMGFGEIAERSFDAFGLQAVEKLFRQTNIATEQGATGLEQGGFKVNGHGCQTLIRDLENCSFIDSLEL